MELNQTTYKRFIFIVFFMLYNFSISFSQDIYRYQNAEMFVKYVSSDSIFLLASREVEMQLDNNGVTFNVVVDKSTFKSSNVSINEQLERRRGEKITLSGVLNLERIDRFDHIPIDFSVEGKINYSRSKFNGNGRLEHISSEGNLNCLLIIKFNLKFEDVDFSLKGLEFAEEVQIDIVQVLLNNY